MKKLIVVLVLIIFPICFLRAQLNGKIKVYFTNPVNTTIPSAVNAVYLNSSMDDTLVEYINRAKYTLDIAVYNYQQSLTGMANIATAVNNAAARGVVVRWIFDASQSNSGMTALSAGVHVFGSPTTAGYGIMHNKFMIVDANSSNVNDPIVWTGSTNWTKTHFNANANNTIVIQDKNLALAYLAEFNEMWGDAGIVPNTTNSKFGPFKTDNTPHSFVIGGSVLELYFSPSDGTNTKILNAINSANSDLYFGMLTFSETNNSNAISNVKNTGVYVAGIIDQSSLIYAPYSQLTTALGADFKVYSQLLSVYHNKILIADPCNTSSDPIVITGSHNWTISANAQNDENTLIIHNDTVATIFQQSFSQNFIDLGGTLAPCSANVGINETIENKGEFAIYPNPTSGIFTVQSSEMISQIDVLNTLGEKIYSSQINSTSAEINLTNLSTEVYLIKIYSKETVSVKRIIVQ